MPIFRKPADGFSIRNEAISQDTTSNLQDNCVVGLCTGLFAATAITSAPSLPALIPIAVQMVLVAFRTGLYVTGMAEQLESVEDVPQSWSHVVPDISEERATEALADFQAMEASATFTSVLRPKLTFG